jgi:hypothetical protein
MDSKAVVELLEREYAKKILMRQKSKDRRGNKGTGPVRCAGILFIIYP